MKNASKASLGLAAVLLLTAGCTAMAGEVTTKSAAEVKPPFSGPANVAYAERLWGVLESGRLVGPKSIVSYPYEGGAPHGGMLELLQTTVTVDGHADVVMVKKNYRGEGSVEDMEHAIFADRMGNLDSVTVMFRREAGYDPDNKDWFWAKYNPDGSLATNPKGMKLAGRVARGADQGCIACHKTAEGGDYVFSHDQFH